MELSAALDIIVSEGTVGKPIFKQCEEAFMTNAMIEIMPVTSMNDESGASMVVGGGKMGPITRQLLQAYRDRVEKETKA
jgi:4-amino-4-deoxychorismate lyase